MSRAVMDAAIAEAEESGSTMSMPCQNPECAAFFEVPRAEMLRCGMDKGRPRPACPACGRVQSIGPSSWFDEETGKVESAW